MLGMRHELTTIVFHQVMFLLTGLSTTLGTQWLFYHKAATGDSYLAQLSQYLGMVMVGLLIPILLRNKQKRYQQLNQQEDVAMASMTEEPSIAERYEEGPVQHRSIMKLAVLDVFANFCVTFGFAIVGSGMYQVIYSSVVIWCAILTWFLMNRKLSKLQWIAIVGTSVGLTVSSFDSFNVQTEAASLLLFGTLMTIGGTFFYACVYVYSDYIMSQQKPPPLAARVCFTTGLYTSAISCLWILVYTLPRFSQLIQPTASIEAILGMYGLVSVSNACHSWNYYELIDRTGSVATGILQGLRAVLIYVISDAWYCSSDAAQCFTPYKGLGSILVIGCVLLFTVGRSPS
ncbi:hypothetical protein BD560DRAFT_400441 [Blakeslea trispora]|nr:hypothetical protein BD560DRAFT_400441 [Blakeslea trispora]